MSEHSISEYIESVREAAEFVAGQLNIQPKKAVIFGTGMSAIAEEIAPEFSLSFDQIPHYPEPTVDTHEGRLIFGHIGEEPVIALQGRLHLYEGYTPQEVTFPIRLLGELGVTVLVCTNAAGGMHPTFTRGDIVYVTDHINLQGSNPLEGANEDDWGMRFLDMTEPYDSGLRKIVKQVAVNYGVEIKPGVYVAVEGPSLETRAEYRYLANLGADLVGMSTVPEVIVARHMDMRLLVLSVITDECQPGALEPIDIDKVFGALNSAQQDVSTLVRETLMRAG